MTECTVCLEGEDDLKCLPCWHVICQNCLHGVIGSERTVKCPICRKLCLSGRAENLPPPVSCESCEQFSVNPKWFQPCMHVHCLDCVHRLEIVDGKHSCLACQSALEGDLKNILICQRCHRLHSDVELPCRHSLCTECYRENRECTLCKVITEDHQRAVEQNQRVLVDITRNVLLQNNLQNSVQRRTNTNQSHDEDDINKTLMFVFCFLFPAYYWGIGIGLYLASIVIFVAIRPPRDHMIGFIGWWNILLQILAIYYFFYTAVIVSIFHLFLSEILRRFWSFGEIKKLLIIACFELALWLLLLLYCGVEFPIYFLHQFFLGIFLGVLRPETLITNIVSMQNGT